MLAVLECGFFWVLANTKLSEIRYFLSDFAVVLGVVP